MDIPVKIAKARTKLMIQKPFWGYLSCVLKPKEVEWVGTFGTDGKYLYYNSKFMELFTIEELQFIFAHEIMHIALEHFVRLMGRDEDRWGSATDLAINGALLSENWTMPKCYPENCPNLGCEGKKKQRPYCGLYENRYKDMASEKIYELLGKEPSGTKDGGKREAKPGPRLEANGKRGKGDGNSDGSKDKKEKHDKKPNRKGLDEHLKPPEQHDRTKNGVKPTLDKKALENFKEEIIAAAQTARQQGNMPGMMKSIVDDIVSPKINWRKLLYRFIVNNVAMNDYTYSRLKRQYMAQGLAIPTMRSPDLPPVVIGIDSSGSISDKELQQFVSEVQYIGRIGFNFDAHIMVCDTCIMDYRKVKARKINWKEIKLLGRGGTDFRPVFEKVTEERIKPSCLIYLTDGYGSYPEKPRYPVLWIMVDRNDKPPFGQRIVIKD